MEIYELFFDNGCKNDAYPSEREFREDVMSMIDACLYGIVQYKELWGERLEMRGVVITPQEFETALVERRLEDREQRRERREQVSAQLRQIMEHVISRVKACGQGFWDFRLSRAVKGLDLTKFEWLCYLMAAATEWDRKYERIYGYLQDNVGAKLPTVGLATSLFRLAFPEEAELGENPENVNSKNGEKQNGERQSDSPLWIYLFSVCKETGLEESRLSCQMKLRPSVIRWLEDGCSFSHRLSWGVQEEAGRLYVDMAAARSMEKEGLISMIELLTTAAWAGDVMNLADKRLYLLNGRGMEEGLLKRVATCFERWGIPYTSASPDGKMETGTGLIRLKPAFTFADLILEEAASKQLHQLCGRVEYRETVQSEWGFAKKSPYGNGVSALFYGPPGTGKTMAAQAVAARLGVDLLKVDISGLISKYIGETQKNLNRVFNSAAETDCVLFFDEADGLFARRTQVSLSNDRYANMETGYLLQKFEEYEGICILATNCFYNMDDAFKRRIGEIIRFSFPSEETRLKLWKSMVPKEARVDEELELGLFASRFEMTGSAVKEVVTGAAYRAAMNGRGIVNEDVREALKSHYMKYGRTLTAGDLDP